MPGPVGSDGASLATFPPGPFQMEPVAALRHGGNVLRAPQGVGRDGGEVRQAHGGRPWPAGLNPPGRPVCEPGTSTIRGVRISLFSMILFYIIFLYIFFMLVTL